MVRKHSYAYIRTIVVLTGGKLTEFYFPHLLFKTYYSVLMHLRSVKKISILPSGDVNPRPIPSRRNLLEDSPYHAVWAVCLSYDWP
jgi:hypothetical protein